MSEYYFFLISYRYVFVCNACLLMLFDTSAKLAKCQNHMLLQIYYDFFFSFFIIIKALKNIADFFSNTYSYTTYYKLFSFQSNLHLRLQTSFYSAKICTVVLLQINFHSVLYTIALKIRHMYCAFL